MLNNKYLMTSFAFIFSVIYIFLEITFNIGLIDFINSKNTEIDVFQNLERLGRILASLGFALFTIKLLKSMFKKMNNVIVTLGFILLAIGFYNIQTIVFNRILDNMNSEQKLLAYNIGVHRTLSLNGQINLSLLNKEDPVYDSIVNSMIFLLNNDKNQTLIQKSNEDFFNIHYEIDKKMFGNIYDKLESVNSNEKFHEYYKIYKIESKHYENSNDLFKNKYKENFIKTIGLEPSLSESEFVKQLKEQQLKKSGIDLKNIVIIPENKTIGLKALKLGDIPSDLTKDQWINFVNNHIEKALESVKLNMENVKDLPYSHNIISSVVITPIAIVLSLASIILNIGLLIGKRYPLLTGFWFAIAMTNFILFSYNPYNLNPVINKTIGVEKTLLSLTKPYKDFIHKTFVNDNNVPTFKVIRIEKPKMPKVEDRNQEINTLFEKLKKNNNQIDNSKINENMYVDDNKINEKNYYGELNKKNPYAK